MNELERHIDRHMKSIKEDLKKVDWSKLQDASPERQFLESTQRIIERYEIQRQREDKNDQDGGDNL